MPMKFLLFGKRELCNIPDRNFLAMLAGDHSFLSYARCARGMPPLCFVDRRSVGVLVLLLVIGFLPAAETNPRLQGLMDEFEASSIAAQEAYVKAIRKADDDRVAALLAARERTVVALKSLMAPRGNAIEPTDEKAQGTRPGSSTAHPYGDIIEQAEIYKCVLSVQHDDPEAVRFFSAIDPLRQVLTSIKTTSPARSHALVFGEASVEGAVLSLWNQYNSGFGDRGADKVQVQLFSGARLVHEAGPLEVPWAAGADQRLDIPLPRKVMFDRVRVAVLSWQGQGGGLSEMQLMSNGVNLLANWKPSASETYDPVYFDADRIIDGITTSRNFAKGYWLLPNNTTGWIELNGQGISQE